MFRKQPSGDRRQRHRFSGLSAGRSQEQAKRAPRISSRMGHRTGFARPQAHPSTSSGRTEPLGAERCGSKTACAVLDSAKSLLASRWHVQVTSEASAANSFKRGPRDWLRQTAGAAAPSGLSAAAPKPPARFWTARGACASRAGTSGELHAVSDRGGSKSSTCPSTAQATTSRSLQTVGESRGWWATARQSSRPETSIRPWSRSQHCAAR